mmetsp:Transcript_40762/g.128461  ORF Transcript_40762/g.128461 Transcript_40762/m.128461 type:complete len:208 (+) Transcript_40762:2799-3422(+)
MFPTIKHAMIMAAPSSQLEQALSEKSSLERSTGPPQMGLRGQDAPRSATHTSTPKEMLTAAATSKMMTVVSCIASKKRPMYVGGGGLSTLFAPYFNLRCMSSEPVRPCLRLDPRPLARALTPPSSSIRALFLSDTSSSSISLLNSMFPRTLSWCPSSSMNAIPAAALMRLRKDDPLEEPLEDCVLRRGIKGSSISCDLWLILKRIQP